MLRYIAVSVILGLLLIASEGVGALRFDGRAGWAWLYGTMAFTVDNFLVFLGQKMTGSSGAVLASIMMALMPIASVLVMCVYTRTTPSGVHAGMHRDGVPRRVARHHKGRWPDALINRRRLIPEVLIQTGMVAWVIHTIGDSRFTVGEGADVDLVLRAPPGWLG